MEEINLLKKSQLFNLSLSSKELFHSNFLSYYFNQYIIETTTIFQSLLPDIKLGNLQNVLREYKNSDIILQFENKSIIIELKIKSIASEGQLTSYRDKLGHDNIYYLFSLIKPNFDCSKLNWNILNIDTLTTILIELSSKINDSYDKYLLNDYVTFITNLNSLVSKKHVLNISDNFNLYGEEFNMLKSLRIHDLYLKNKLNQLKALIHEKINEKNLRAFVNIVNGKGVLNIELEYPLFWIGVMIDGPKYCKYITHNKLDDKTFEDDCVNLISEKIWFEFDTIQGTTYPKDGRFNKFKELKYISKTIPTEMNFSTLINKIVKDIVIAKTLVNTNKISFYIPQ